MKDSKTINGELKPATPPGSSERVEYSSRIRSVMADSRSPVRFDANGALVIPDYERDDLELLTKAANARANRAAMENAARHVVRVDMKNQMNIGTAVIVARGVAATCRHVVTEFANPKVGGTQDQFWEMDASKIPKLVFTAGNGAAEKAVEVTGVMFAADHKPLPQRPGDINYRKPEIAFISFDHAPLAAFDPAISFGLDYVPPYSRVVAVIGFPSRDYTRICTNAELKGANFQRSFDKMVSVFGPENTVAPWEKCAGVGIINHPVGSVAPNRHNLFATHTAPTLPGASGGAVFDLTTGKLAGIHCSGMDFFTNFCQLFEVLKDRPAGYPKLKAYLTRLLA